MAVLAVVVVEGRVATLRVEELGRTHRVAHPESSRTLLAVHTGHVQSRVLVLRLGLRIHLVLDPSETGSSS